ncbi:hypothetical protein [Streptomyces goshikiensis]|uniref:hypothetical protein n=1 Tax=Streptomyces goshikiensis TaxID=1942 RepID=UPI003410D687
MFATLPANVTQDSNFVQLLAEFDADPQKQATRRRGPAVGTGVSIADLSVYVLPAVAWVLGVVGERVTDRATDALSEAARSKAAVLLGRLRRRQADPPDEPAPAQAAEPRTAWSAEERAAFVTAFQILFVQRLGLEADPAEVLAEAIATALDDPLQKGSDA